VKENEEIQCLGICHQKEATNRGAKVAKAQKNKGTKGTTCNHSQSGGKVFGGGSHATKKLEKTNSPRRQLGPVTEVASRPLSHPKSIMRATIHPSQVSPAETRNNEPNYGRGTPAQPFWNQPSEGARGHQHKVENAKKRWND